MKKVAPPPPPSIVPLSKHLLTNGDLAKAQKGPEVPQHAPMSATPGEDCAFDELLEGRMELEVVLPDNRAVNMTVDRRTPMMDLLVHAATANNISPGGHVIKVISKEDHNVLYKPNTPIGSLDVNTMYIVPKSTVEIPVKRMPKLANQPFEQTFRLQVNLPRNQRMVLRVSPRISLADLKRQICSEKELDHSNHHLVHPAEPDTVLDLNATLDIYGCAEISLMSNSGLRDSIRSSSTHLLGYTKVEDDKKKKGILRLFSKKKKEGPVETNTNGLGSRGVSPTRCNEILNRDSYQPKQSIKRKPAPAPPPPIHPPSPPLVIQSSSSINSRPESEISAKTDELGSTVSHSRHSSDSSGYHEPSVFSDCSENKSPEASIVHCGHVLSGHDSKDHLPDSLAVKQITPVKETSNLKVVPSCSTTSIASRKRKAPQPPAPVLPEVETPSSPEQSSDEQNPITLAMNKPPVSLLPGPKTDGELLMEDAEETHDPEQDAGVFEIGDEEDDLVSETSDASADHGAGDTDQQAAEAITCLENVLESEVPGSSSSNLFSVSNKLPDDDEESDVIVDLPRNYGNELKVENSDDMCSQSSASVMPNDSQCAANSPCPPTDSSTELPPVPLNEEDILSENVNRLPSLEAESIKNSSDVDSLRCSINVPQGDIEVQSSEPVADVVGCDQMDSDDGPQLLQTQNSPESAPSNASLSSIVESNPIIKNDISLKDSTKPTAVGSPLTQRRLVSFAMGCYKKEETDIYSEHREHHQQVTFQNKTVEKETTESKVDIRVPDVKIASVSESRKGELGLKTNASSEDSSTKVSCETDAHPTPGRSVSMNNLNIKKVIVNSAKPPPLLEETKSTPSLNRTQSDQNLCQEKSETDEKSDFIQEQKRLHEEYLKLQAQFISWQKQLLNNQSLLQNEKILPQMALGALEQFQSELGNFPALLLSKTPDVEPPVLTKPVKEPTIGARPKIDVSRRKETAATPPRRKANEITVHAEINKIIPQEIYVTTDSKKESDSSRCKSPGGEKNSDEASKCRTLPRQTNRPPVSAFETTRTMTLNRPTRQKAQVSLSIGSWQQRNEAGPSIDSASVASSRSMFQSLENVNQKGTEAPTLVQKVKRSSSTASSSEKQKATGSVKHPEITAIVSVKEPVTPAASTSTESNSDMTNDSREKLIKPSSSRHHSQSANQRTKEKPASLDARGRQPSKPLVRLSSMKDDNHPPPLHALKKWPLSDIKEKDATPAPTKPGERSLWEEVKASAKRSAGATQEKTKRAEVNLRKPKTPKTETVLKSVEAEPTAASKIHVTKINIYSADKAPNSSQSVVETRKISRTVITPTETAKKDIPQNDMKPFNAELRSVLSKRASAIEESSATTAEPFYAEAVNGQNQTNPKSVAINGSSPPPPPPPPPPVSTMPAIPPAAPIPKSSQLLMDKSKSKAQKLSRNQQPKMSSKDPREELMLEIRGFGGRQALRKSPTSRPAWHLKVYGSASVANS